jgi:hypothetical protein
MNLDAARGVAIREFPLRSGHGFADYLLYVDGLESGDDRRMQPKRSGPVRLCDRRSGGSAERRDDRGVLGRGAVARLGIRGAAGGGATARDRTAAPAGRCW